MNLQILFLNIIWEKPNKILGCIVEVQNSALKISWDIEICFECHIDISSIEDTFKPALVIVLKLPM